MRLLILTLSVILSSWAHGSAGGTIQFSGSISKSPCLVEVKKVEPLEWHENITTNCAPTKQVSAKAVYRSTDLVKKELAGYMLIIEYR